MACIASFISNLGYLFELSAKSEETYLSALKLSYAGRVWIVFAFFLFSARMCNIKIPKGLLVALLLAHVGIYVSVLRIGSSSLYYTDYEFVPDPVFPKFYHGNGSIHDLLGTREIAKDFAIDRISEGVIAVDNEGRIQYYNRMYSRASSCNAGIWKAKVHEKAVWHGSSTGSFLKTI